MNNRQQPNAEHTNPRAVIAGTFDFAFTHRELIGREVELHEHYASNARACGHTEQCMKVTIPVNWPTLCGQPLCTCGRGEPWIHPLHRLGVTP